MIKKNFNAPFELKKLDEGGLFEGYASVFGVKDYDGDVIVQGAFKTSIEKYASSGKRPKMLWQHNPSIIIGKWIELREDEKGLYVKGTLFTDVEKGREAYALMKHGELDGMSVGFNMSEPRYEDGGRVIDDLDLWEISVVTWGANPDALISSVKSIDNERDFEKFLRESGFSRNEAKRITSKGFKSGITETVVEDDQRDVDSEIVNALKSAISAIKKGDTHGGRNQIANPGDGRNC